jgi:nucleoside-diphosphate kinase
MERTFVLLKPEAVKRKVIGLLVARFERANLDVTAIRMIRPSRSIAGQHYPDREDWYRAAGSKTARAYERLGIDLSRDFAATDPVSIGKVVQEWLVTHLTSGEVVAMIIEGEHAVEAVRKLVGKTLPLTAPPGTIRGDYVTDYPDVALRERRAVYNIVHASDTSNDAEREISIWLG